jgi:hypothetical protein
MTVYVRDPAGRARLALSYGPPKEKDPDGVRTIIEARMLFKAVRERWHTEGNPRKGEPRVYAWVHDFGDDWCVFRVESARDRKLMLVSYSIMEGSVSFGEPVEVTHTSVYEPIESSLK